MLQTHLSMSTIENNFSVHLYSIVMCVLLLLFQNLKLIRLKGVRSHWNSVLLQTKSKTEILNCCLSSKVGFFHGPLSVTILTLARLLRLIMNRPCQRPCLVSLRPTRIYPVQSCTKRLLFSPGPLSFISFLSSINNHKLSVQ